MLEVPLYKVYNITDCTIRMVYPAIETILHMTHKIREVFMRKLALNDEILLNIEKPARYIGNEVNSVMKDKEKVDIRFAMCFPDVTE